VVVIVNGKTKTFQSSLAVRLSKTETCCGPVFKPSKTGFDLLNGQTAFA